MGNHIEVPAMRGLSMDQRVVDPKTGEVVKKEDLKKPIDMTPEDKKYVEEAAKHVTKPVSLVDVPSGGKVIILDPMKDKEMVETNTKNAEDAKKQIEAIEHFNNTWDPSRMGSEDNIFGKFSNLLGGIFKAPLDLGNGIFDNLGTIVLVVGGLALVYFGNTFIGSFRTKKD